jgi:Flp pilus assembly protein TadB
MESASRRGLGLGPFLQSLISIIDLEMQTNERIQSIQRSVRVQAVLAALVPWCLGAVTTLFQPEIVQSFLATLDGKLILGITIVVEGVGLWAVKEAIRFY